MHPLPSFALSLALVLPFAAQPALAQKGPMPPAGAAAGARIDPAVIDACLDGGGWMDCVGAASDACIAATMGADTSAIRTGCQDAEAEWWAAQIPALLDELSARDMNLDEVTGVDPEAGPRAELLTGLHRAWVEYRDLSCLYEGLRWGAASEIAEAASGCRMVLTGEHVLTLQSYNAEG